jgi:hypothetical protein
MTNDHPPLDEDLFEEFSRLYLDDYEYLAPSAVSKEKNKEEFLKGKIENPSFNYYKLLSFDFKKKENGFRALREKTSKHKSAIVKKAYIDRVDEMLQQIKMLEAARNKNDLEFTKYSEQIYGRPSLEIFAFDLSLLEKTISIAFSSKNPLRIKSAHILQKTFPNLAFNESIEKDFRLLPPPIDDPGEPLDSSEIKNLFEKTAEDLGIKNWQIVTDNTAEKINLSANQEEKKIYIPTDDSLRSRGKKITRTGVLALIAHELATHAKRRENGEKSRLKLLGLGLDHFLKGEEGLASYKAQQLEGARDFAGFGSHFSVSCTLGLDGKMRNFREVFDILKNYFIASINNEGDKILIEKAENAAWNTCVRCFRGTTCKTPGAVFTKGHIYREGNIEIYRLIESGSKEIKRIMAGKYDPANKKHTTILDELGI